ncbi:3431_t:CDS:2, partial [Ambispora leptoticha]
MIIWMAFLHKYTELKWGTYTYIFSVPSSVISQCINANSSPISPEDKE